MNSLGNCRAEFSGWRFTQLCLVPRQVMDMEKNWLSFQIQTGGTREPGALSLVENGNCNHSFLCVQERRVFLTFWFFFLQVRVLSPQSPSILFVEGRNLNVKARLGKGFRYTEKESSRSVVSDSAIPCTVAYQAPPSMGFSRQEYHSGLPLPSPGDLPNPGIKPGSPAL